MNCLPKRNRDLKRYALRRDLFRLLGYLLWIAIWIGSALVYNAEHPNYPHRFQIVGWRMFFLVAATLVSGFLFFRIWRLFTDRTVRGVIEVSSLSHSYSASSDPGGAVDYDFRLNTKLRIRKSDGKTKTLCFEQKRGFYHYYYEGKSILSIHGLPYPIRTDDDPSVGYVCAVCGTWSETKANICAHCGRSMIDPKEIDG